MFVCCNSILIIVKSQLNRSKLVPKYNANKPNWYSKRVCLLVSFCLDKRTQNWVQLYILSSYILMHVDFCYRMVYANFHSVSRMFGFSGIFLNIQSDWTLFLFQIFKYFSFWPQFSIFFCSDRYSLCLLSRWIGDLMILCVSGTRTLYFLEHWFLRNSIYLIICFFFFPLSCCCDL